MQRSDQDSKIRGRWSARDPREPRMVCKLSEDRRENQLMAASDARASGLEAGRQDEQMGERLGLLTRTYFSRFSTNSRPDMNVR